MGVLFVFAFFSLQQLGAPPPVYYKPHDRDPQQLLETWIADARLTVGERRERYRGLTGQATAQILVYIRMAERSVVEDVAP